MAEKRNDISIVLSGKDQTGPAFKSATDRIKTLKGALGEESLLGNAGKLLLGAGAIGGLSVLTRVLADSTNKARELVDQFRAGKIEAGDMADQLARSVPVLGSIYTAGRNIRELITGAQSEVNAILASAAAQTANLANRTGLRDAAGGAQNAIGGQREKLVNSFTPAPAIDVRLAQQNTRDAILQINKTLKEITDGIDKAAKYSVPGEDGKSVDIVGVNALRTRMREMEQEIVRLDEERRVRAPVYYRDDGSKVIPNEQAYAEYQQQPTPERDRLANQVKEIQAQINAANTAINQATSGAKLNTGLQYARGATDLGKIFVEEFNKRFSAGVADRQKEIELDAATRNAAKKTVSDTIIGIVKGGLDGLQNGALAVGGQAGVDKYLRSQSIVGTLFNAFAKVTAIKGNGATESPINPNAGPVPRAGIVGTRYVAGYSNSNTPEIKAATTTANNSKVIADLIRQQLTTAQQTLDLLRRGGSLIAGTGL